jgi:hypothetical protein
MDHWAYANLKFRSAFSHGCQNRASIIASEIAGVRAARRISAPCVGSTGVYASPNVSPTALPQFMIGFAHE